MKHVIVIAGLVCLLNLPLVFSAETVEQERVVQILATAKEIKATDAQIATAIAEGVTPKEFAAQLMGRIRLIAPDKAPVGSPVQIAVEGMPKKVTELWRIYPKSPNDVWLELYDRGGNSVNIFWSSDQRPVTFELIVAENGKDVPTLDIATHKMQYGDGPAPGPTPIPFPEPPTPSNQLQMAVQPILQFATEIGTSPNSGGGQDLLNLTEFYSDFADIVRRDDGNIIATTAIFRSTYINAGSLMFQQTGMKGKYTNLSEIVDKVLSDSLGLDIVSLDATKTADILNAVAWAFYPRGGN